MRSPWLSARYKKSPAVKALPKTVQGRRFYVLLNPDLGSWAVLDEVEYQRYQEDRLTEVEAETLFLRGLILDADSNGAQLEFPKPAEFPSVVVVNITTTCNLRCKYCFADCEPQKGDFMQEDVMRRVIEEMLSMPSNRITFELQGGEPLCYKTGMRRFIEISEEMNKTRGKSIQYRVVTNGTLIDDEFIDLAKKYNIRFGVSLDGPKDMTNQVRLRADGSGAFDDIVAGIHRAQEAGLKIDGSVCTLGQHNCHEGVRIAEFFAQLGIPFKPRPANILGREIESMTTTKSGEWADAYKTLYYRSKELGITNFSIHIYEENVYTPVRDYICLRYPCGAAREILSVNPDGTVYPCDGFKGETHFSMGNIKDESIRSMLKKDWVVELRNRTSETIKKCRSCLYRGMCCSCCYSAYGAYGTVYREDPQCEDRRKIFDFLIEEWIRRYVIGEKPHPAET
jgi:radical SAM protein with 4Fe4S-binding SPASM domain